MAEGLFAAAGSLVDQYDEVDWAATSLGPVDTWGPSLRAAVGLMLRSRFPITLLWGPDYVLVYNEAYVPLIADKHPQALGQPARSMFAESWDVIGPLLDGVREGGEGIFMPEEMIPLDRRGFLEDCFWTFSYSPVVGEDGRVEGIIDISIEISRQVITQRRLALLARLNDGLAELEDVEDVERLALDLMLSDPDDLPAVALRAYDARATASDQPAVVEADGLPLRPERELRGRRVLLEQRAGHTLAWVPLRAVRPDGTTPVLVVRLNDRIRADRDYVAFLRLCATALVHVLDRVEALEAERRVAESERAMSEALQRSLLTRPMEPDHLQVAVRYVPAVDVAQVGGDWHDSFLLPSGDLALTIGDVVGHDRESAAEMGQLRNILRGIAFSVDEAPSRILELLDRAMSGLDVDTFASAVLARVHQTPEQATRGVRTLRWCNAGHLPPVIVRPDGTATLLEAAAEPLLGLEAGTERTDHEVLLEAGASVVLYTDGLVERRGTSLDDGIGRLLEVLTGRQDLDAERLSDLVLEQLATGSQDDVAFLVLRAYDERRPRPPEAGPEVLPREWPVDG